MIIINRSILFFCLLSSFFSVNGSFKKNISDTLELRLDTHHNSYYFELYPTKKCIDFSMNTKYSYEVLCTGTKDLKTGKFHLESHYIDRTCDVLPFDVPKKKDPKLFPLLKDATEFLESFHLGTKTRNNKKRNFNWYLESNGSLRIKTNIDGQKRWVKHVSGKNLLDSATLNILYYLQNHNIYDEERINDGIYKILNTLEVPDKEEKNKALSLLRKILEKKMYINPLNKGKNPLIDLSKIIKSLYKGTIKTNIIKNSTDFFHNKIKHEFYCEKNLDTEKFNNKVTYAKILRQKKYINGTFTPQRTTTPKRLPTDELTENQKETIKMMKEKINLLHKAIETTFFFKNEKVANKTQKLKNL